MANKNNKAVGDSFEDLKDEEMKKTQGAGDTEAETIGLIRTATLSFSVLGEDYDEKLRMASACQVADWFKHN
ncbi:type 2 lantibiotic [Butyrivibrio sp. X503]|uniref:mersacidin family lantibiotic n=1 Tax=Butyrivibrio sp. X503 TaxID=2364878 RepID=UPI000EA9F7DE|nr:lichenicidin A2 family type 2 lantibiotic [Butyrivibrio sp. X503]RKM55309.1 type 2 lantibiotic [Butyrivibrio sp. X503]